MGVVTKQIPNLTVARNKNKKFSSKMGSRKELITIGAVVVGGIAGYLYTKMPDDPEAGEVSTDDEAGNEVTPPSKLKMTDDEAGKDAIKIDGTLDGEVKEEQQPESSGSDSKTSEDEEKNNTKMPDDEEEAGEESKDDETDSEVTPPSKLKMDDES